jgi:hypothetical protein
MIKQRRVGWTGNVVRMEEIKDSETFQSQDQNGREHLGDLKIELKLRLKGYDVRI